MNVVPFNPGMKITNLQALGKGTGAKYLEVIEPHQPDLPLIAVKWCRKMPRKIEKGHHLIEFKK
jgi:hypothetical protein